MILSAVLTVTFARAYLLVSGLTVAKRIQRYFEVEEIGGL
jgi:hypothetical protein